MNRSTSYLLIPYSRSISNSSPAHFPEMIWFQFPSHVLSVGDDNFTQQTRLLPGHGPGRFAGESGMYDKWGNFIPFQFDRRWEHPILYGVGRG